MKSLKNALCIFLAAVMAFSVIGLSAFAADPVLPADASYVSGDADGNAIVNSADALTIMNHTVGNAKMTDIVRITAADVSNDNVVNSSDALYILNFKVGNIKEFNRKSLNLTKVAGNIMLDPYTGCVVDAAGVGLIGYGYDRNAKVFYATGEGWQREFGYSEMYDVAAVIASMPLDIVKLDKSLVDEMNNPDMMTVIKNTIRMLKKLDKKILVEGVETEEAFKQFVELDCDYIQGYYYSKPIPVEKYEEYL